MAASPTPVEHFRVKDRVVEHDPATARRIGQVLACVCRFQIFNGEYVQFTLQSALDFTHTICDASQLSRDRLLLVTLDELPPPEGWEGPALTQAASPRARNAR